MTAAAPLPLPDPPLADRDLALRPWRAADAAVLTAAWADPEIARWTGVPVERDEAAARRWIESTPTLRQRGLALDLVVDVAGEAVGEVGLVPWPEHSRTAELGWWVAAPHRRRGVATRAVRLVAGWALDGLGLDGIIARCHPANPASGRVAASAGFVRAADASSGGSGSADGPAPPLVRSGSGELWVLARDARGGTVPS